MKLIALLLFPFAVFAGEPDMAYRAAVHYSKYTAGAQPIVQAVPPSFFDQKGGNLRGRATMALYKGGVIYLSERLNGDGNQVARMGWLVHEMVHHLQHLAGVDLTDCESASKAEAEALSVQNRYLSSTGHMPQVLLQAKGPGYC